MSEEPIGYSVLVALYTREEAEVMASALRADGVDAFVEPNTHQGMTWLYTLGLGGLRVFVPRDQVEEARNLVRTRLSEFADADLEERVERRDRWKVWLIAIALYGVNAYWLYVQSKDWPPEEGYNLIEWISGVTFAPVWTGR
jgi:hypothetical protein